VFQSLPLSLSAGNRLSKMPGLPLAIFHCVVTVLRVFVQNLCHPNLVSDSKCVFLASDSKCVFLKLFHIFVQNIFRKVHASKSSCHRLGL
jgi:hypothetical protein